ncbi:5,10-methylenetetrahydrofolate reductase [hydrothermal vent metagenome]|uniref:methylenetetrahydrofolate reductase (NADH) n=1 Tax=hydrothermal vent metagenome TaxID=652676 RepID=A0A3B0WIA6_9ZZZZ
MSLANNTGSTVKISCEFFPPRTEAGVEKLQSVQEILDEAISPEYYSVTFGAGGSTRDSTLEIIKLLSAKNINVAPHISCIGSTKQQLNDLLTEYKNLGVTRLVTLRGDIPKSGESTKELAHANELVSFIRETTGNHFTLEVAAYPEYHPESTTPQSDFEHFKNKVAAGADGAITQYFYNIDAYQRFIDNCQRENISIPITPGIMPITNFQSLTRFSDTCGAEIPRWIRKQLEAYADDKESLQSFGVDVVSHLCNQLIERGVPGLHFYTLNQTTTTHAIWKNLSL